MAKSKRGTNLSMASFLDQDDLARALREGGSPRLADLHPLPAGTGFYCKLLRAIWGASRAEYDAAVAYDLALEQRQRPHVFVRKWQTRRR